MRRWATLSTSFATILRPKGVVDCFTIKSYSLSFGSTIISWKRQGISWKLSWAFSSDLLMASPTSLKRAHIQKMSRCRIKMKIRFLSDQSDSCQLSKFITCDLRSLILIQVSRLKIKLCNKNQLFFHFSIWISIGGFGVLGYGGLGGIPDLMPIAQNLEMEIQMEKWKKS